MNHAILYQLVLNYGRAYMEDKGRIHDIPSIRELHQQLNNLKNEAPMPSVIGVDKSKQEEILEKIRKAEPEIIRMSTLPDRFNELFVDHGWIMYEMMSDKAAETAIARAKSEGIDSAETYLANCYTEEIIKSNIKRMKDIEAFQPRWYLAQKALNDYLEGRYYACVHVVQAILDGMVNEIYLNAYGYRKNFYAKDTDLIAWDSISAHSKGLILLSKTLGRARNSTRTEEIFTPYRHGIVHGTDLSYDNKIVAAKIWAALFSVRTWAMKAEKGELKHPLPPKKSVSWDMVPKRERRTINLGQEVPITGLPEVYEVGTPERRLAEYLTCWAKNRFDKMTVFIPLNPNDNNRINPGKLRDICNDERLRSWTFEGIKDTADARTEIKAKLNFEEAGRNPREPTEHVFFMINMPERGWCIYNWNWINFR
jgi:hypothetical protein